METIVYAFFAALLASLALTPLARRVAAQFGIVDAPDGKRKLQANAVPLLGGIAVYFSLLVGLLVAVFVAPSGQELPTMAVVLITAVAGFICLVGCIDDRYGMNPRMKLGLQIVATLPFVFGGYCIERTALLGFPLELGWLGIPLTIVWLVACINALNLLDGMDGLASVVGLSTAAMIALIAIDSTHTHVAVMAVVLVGALSGFLIYNFPPASIYLGDSGSMVIGLMVGVLAMQGAMKSSATLSLMVPAVVMTIPLLDTALAVIRRKLSGTRFDVADRGHIHHCLLRRGLTVWQALCMIGALCVATGAAAAAASIWHFEALAWVAAITVATILVRTRAFGHYELSLVKLAAANALTRFASRLAASAGLVPVAGAVATNDLTLDAAWQALIVEAEKLDAATLEMRRADEFDHVTLRSWSVSPGRFNSKSSWDYSVRTEAAPDAWIELHASGEGQGTTQGWNQLQLHRLLQRFHSDWSARAVVMAEEMLSLPAVVCLPGIPEPVEVDFPLLRAA